MKAKNIKPSGLASSVAASRSGADRSPRGREPAKVKTKVQAPRSRAIRLKLDPVPHNTQRLYQEVKILNEEFKASTEELKEANKELTKVNEAMVGRNIALNALNCDLTNTETATKVVVVLLGRDLTVRRFSVQAGKQFNLHATDIGRSIRGVRHQLLVPDLEEILTGAIIHSLECEREVQDKGGRWYSLRVRPYLNSESRVDGAVLVLTDIDQLKNTERLITLEREYAEAIIRTVSTPLVVLSADLHIQNVNEAFTGMFQLLPAQVVGHLIFAVSRGTLNFSGLRHLLEDIIPKKRFFDDFEVVQKSKELGTREFLLNARVLNELGGGAKRILLGLRDITARKLAEAALRETRAQLSDHAVHLEGVVTKRTAQLTARTAELTATNLKLKASVVVVSKAKEQYQRLFLESQIMQKKLRQLTHQIIAAQEDERKEISRELHDTVVQTLVGINVELSALGAGTTDVGAAVKAQIERTQRLVEGSVEAVHRFARELRPAVLDDLGLIPAIHAFSRNLAESKQLKIELTAAREVESLEAAKRTVLFRVAQEALNNVVRHAHASEVKIRLSEVSGMVRMEISDNGRSFRVKKTLLAKTNKRLGLVGMRERLVMVGGSLTINSFPGLGTTVCAEIPQILEKTKL